MKNQDHVELTSFIAGQWRNASGQSYTTHYPHDNTEVSTLNAGTTADIDEAVAFAESARKKANWAGLKPHERAAILNRIALGIRDKSEELAQLQRLDNGKPITETRALVASAAGTFQYFASACETLEDSITPQRGDFISMSLHEPLGVVGAITPWNSPIASEAQKIAPALAAGCAVVVKPAEITPRMAIELAKIAQKAGLPDGILSVIPGKGSVVGDRLIRHPLVKRIAFTGSTSVGLGIAKIAAEKLMPTSLELGGKSPTIVCADADLDHAVAGVLFGIFSSSGESCIAGSRAFVHASIYDEFKSKLIAATQTLKVGNPISEKTQMGPLITHAHRQSVERYVEMGLNEGGQILFGAQRPKGQEFESGSYYLPTIFEGLNNQAQMCREEIFGPVLALLPWTNEEDLIAQCNDNDYGLAAGIWSQDYKTVWRLGKALQTGTVWVNTYKIFSISTPFGGVKMSGTGREKGRLSIHEYMNQKSYYWGLNEQPLPWSKG